MVAWSVGRKRWAGTLDGSVGSIPRYVRLVPQRCTHDCNNECFMRYEIQDYLLGYILSELIQRGSVISVQPGPVSIGLSAFVIPT